ncbi:MAG TPA: sulfotransferase, partial [Gammaproteobacteria bacterium]
VVALMAKSLCALGRMREAHDLLQSALALQPTEANLREASGVTYMSLGRYGEAAAELQRAIAADPELTEAHANLAVVYEQLNRMDDARALLATGLARWPQQVTLRFIAARLQRRGGDVAQAWEALSALKVEAGLALALQRDIEFELGWCMDALDETDAAMGHFQAAKGLSLAVAAAPAVLREVFPRQLASLKRFYRGATLPAAGMPQRPMPVFLCGFPRSGTTLLDTMLGAHPALWVMEEQPAVQAMLDTYIGFGLVYAEDLAHLAPAQLAALRAAHQRSSRDAGWDGAKGLIDKSPFGTAHLGLIQQVFPGAPVVFMARHPCDVVLSCFMNSFEINSGTVHFTALESAVELYCGVMELWALYRERLPMQQLTVKYEQLIAEPERSLHQLLDFLGVPWSPAVLEHARAALARDRIPTPSYHQVSQPLYQHAQDRWRRYAAYLEPHLSRLEPHIRALGYAV